MMHTVLFAKLLLLVAENFHNLSGIGCRSGVMHTPF